jgi:MGT family glycosyltransferase
VAEILWLNWSGGGNLPPSLGIARVLTERGHVVAFAGAPNMVARVERAGFRAIELTRAYEQLASYPDKWLPTAACYLTSPAVAEQVRAVLAAEQPDLVIVDVAFLVGLVEAARFGRPTAAMCHTSVHRMLEAWRRTMTMFVGLRVEAGFGPLPADLDELWMSHDRLIVTTLEALDQPPCEYAHRHRLRHVGPVLERELHGLPVNLPWPADDPKPLVLVSFSTAPEQGSVPKVQNAIDALARLDVRGVVTVGDSLDPGLLKPADNVVVFATADHDQLMDLASLVVTHGGHGTMMRALTRGVPLVVIPGFAPDQPVNAAAVEAWGAGRALPGDAGAEMIREAVEEVLATPSFGSTARKLSAHFVGVDGAANAADEIEQLLDGPPDQRAFGAT